MLMLEKFGSLFQVVDERNLDGYAMLCWTGMITRLGSFFLIATLSSIVQLSLHLVCFDHLKILYFNISSYIIFILNIYTLHCSI